MAEPRPELHVPVIPDHVVDVVVNRQLSGPTEMVYSDEAADIARLATIKEQLPGIGEVDLVIDYCHYREEWSDDFDRIHFQYERNHDRVAVLEFEFRRDGSFALRHRYVEPEYRRQKVGDRLLKQAETVFQAAANRQQQPVEVWLQLGQRGVLQWLLRNGYTGRDDRSTMLIERVTHHPEQFVFATITDQRDTLDKDDCIFEPNTTSRTLADTVRINVHKIIQPHS